MGQDGSLVFRFDGPPPKSTRITSILGIYAGMAALSLAAVAVRSWTRVHLVKAFGVDDYMIVVAWLFAVGTCVGVFYGCIHTGLGQHVWNLEAADFNGWNAIQMHVTWIHQWALIFTRTSILFFYLRLSPSVPFRTACYILMGLNVAWAITTLVVNITVCSPVRKFWIPEIPGTCRNPIPFYLYIAIINIILDILVYLAPFPMLSKIQVNRRQKLGLYLTFGLGAFTCIASIVRLPYLKILNNSPDYMYMQWGILIWSAIELNVGIICACIPTFKALLSKLSPGSSLGRHYSPDRAYGRSGNSIDQLNASSAGKGSMHSMGEEHQLSYMSNQPAYQRYNKRTPRVLSNRPENESEEMIIPPQSIIAKTEVNVELERRGGATSYGDNDDARRLWKVRPMP